jgi:hypothetical protein
MVLGKVKTFLGFLAVGIGGSFMTSRIQAQEDQTQLFQNYQAMVIIEEYNQHCPVLTRLEAEALNGQIVLANSSFAGKMDGVEKFKKEARIFARRMPCHSTQLDSYLVIARQQAMDNMVNHVILARQVHIIDEQHRQEGRIESGLLLNYLEDDQWKLLDNLYEEVKANYLKQADEEAWDAFLDSVIKVAEERSTVNYIESQATLQSGAPKELGALQAKVRLQDITSYYFNLEKTVRAFIEGADASERQYPYSRPANDFTDWTAFRPRDEALNWAVSYPGCGGNDVEIGCTFFTNTNDEAGVVLDTLGGQEIKSVSLSYRDPADSYLKNINKVIEGPIGSNLLNNGNLSYNIEQLKSSSRRISNEAHLSEANMRYSAQTGETAPSDAKVFILPDATLDNIDKLDKDDVLILTIKTGSGEIENIMPVQNYLRAQNWAYSTQ